MKIVVCTDLAAFQPYALATWPDEQRPGHWIAPWEADSVSVVWGNYALVRTLLQEIPSGLPECLSVYQDLASAMAAHPSLPWHTLPAFSGDTPEPELVAACAAAALAAAPPLP